LSVIYVSLFAVWIRHASAWILGIFCLHFGPLYQVLKLPVFIHTKKESGIKKGLFILSTKNKKAKSTPDFK